MDRIFAGLVLGQSQLTVWWRLCGLWKYLRGRTEWGVMERRGFQAKLQKGTETK